MITNKNSSVNRNDVGVNVGVGVRKLDSQKYMKFMGKVDLYCA